ncbi:hypothetical protein U1Q18_000164 [Sarracenia purpurea var. burkii]
MTTSAPSRVSTSAFFYTVDDLRPSTIHLLRVIFLRFPLIPLHSIGAAAFCQCCKRCCFLLASQRRYFSLPTSFTPSLLPVTPSLPRLYFAAADTASPYAVDARSCFFSAASLGLRVAICSCSSIKVLPLSGFLGLVLADVGDVLCLKMAVFRRGCCLGLFWSRFGLKLLLFASGDCVGSFVDYDLVALARA